MIETAKYHHQVAGKDFSSRVVLAENEQPALPHVKISQVEKTIATDGKSVNLSAKHWDIVQAVAASAPGGGVLMNDLVNSGFSVVEIGRALRALRQLNGTEPGSPAVIQMNGEPLNPLITIQAEIEYVLPEISQPNIEIGSPRQTPEVSLTNPAAQNGSEEKKNGHFSSTNGAKSRMQESPSVLEERVTVLSEKEVVLRPVPERTIPVPPEKDAASFSDVIKIISALKDAGALFPDHFMSRNDLSARVYGSERDRIDRAAQLYKTLREHEDLLERVGVRIVNCAGKGEEGKFYLQEI